MPSVFVQLTHRGQPINLSISFPPSPATIPQMLPALRQATDHLIQEAIRLSEQQGNPISCRKGCNHCCKQVVPLAPAEARALSALVDSLPPARRSVIRRRFAATITNLNESGLAADLRDRAYWEKSDFRDVGLRYLAQDISCPFLEAGLCSIYADRPIACREFMVTTPADNCRHPTPQTVKTVDIPAGPTWHAVARLEQLEQDAPLQWVPLILALEYTGEYAESSQDESPNDAQTLVNQFLENLKSATT